MTRRPPQRLGRVRLEIATPCGVEWESMRGDDTRRFCGNCQKHVHDLTAMTDQQLDAFLAENDEACVRFYRRSDGTVLTSDCPVGLRKRVVRRMALVGGATLAAAASALGALASLTFGGTPGPSCSTEKRLDTGGGDPIGVRRAVMGAMPARVSRTSPLPPPPARAPLVLKVSDDFSGAQVKCPNTGVSNRASAAHGRVSLADVPVSDDCSVSLLGGPPAQFKPVHGGQTYDCTQVVGSTLICK